MDMYEGEKGEMKRQKRLNGKFVIVLYISFSVTHPSFSLFPFTLVFSSLNP